jgi:hypothetical protein
MTKIAKGAYQRAELALMLEALSAAGETALRAKSPSPTLRPSCKPQCSWGWWT